MYYPHIQTGYARSPYESAYPYLWNQLVGAWPFGMQTGGSRYHDFNGGGYSAEIVGGGVLESRDGYRGILLDGIDDSILVGDHDIFTFSSGGMTISAWVWHNTTDVNEAVISKYSKPTQSGGEYTFGSLADGQIYGIIGDQTNNAYRGRISPGPSSSTWNHIVMVHNGGTTDESIFIYLNGIRTDNANLGEGGTFVQMRNTTHTLTIGAADTGLGGPFGGLVDDVLIYNRPLPLSEIQLLYKERYAIFIPRRRFYALTTLTPTSSASSIYYRMNY